MTQQPLAKIAALPRPDLRTIFESDPGRLDRMTLVQGALRFDWSKTHLTAEMLAAFGELAQAQDFAGKRDQLFSGAKINNTEGRAAEHSAERGEGAPESVATAKMLHERMRALIDVIEACIDGTLDQVDLQFEDNAAVCVVLASDGYPVAYEKGLPITGLDEFKKHEGYYCFHAGTKFDGDQIVTNGGRVLGVTAKGATLKEARANAYKATEWVKFDNKYMRHDIGKAIDEA